MPQEEVTLYCITSRKNRKFRTQIKATSQPSELLVMALHRQITHLRCRLLIVQLSEYFISKITRCENVAMQPAKYVLLPLKTTGPSM